MVDGEGLRELLQYIEPDYHVILTGTITSCIMKRHKEMKKPVQPVSMSDKKSCENCIVIIFMSHDMKVT